MIGLPSISFIFIALLPTFSPMMSTDKSNQGVQCLLLVDDIIRRHCDYDLVDVSEALDCLLLDKSTFTNYTELANHKRNSLLLDRLEGDKSFKSLESHLSSHDDEESTVRMAMGIQLRQVE